ncbi:PadR family transcriptional regulator [Homoserinimonas sp. OAct 916]|uniref:PadR family transcriptional regulator n=1 Tax=Homoserinimonas sp. OAct 916 TaxID=2211450 RepID=UPI000DBE6ABA|nr:PadR family transcriptional regulator [Homoserinimonas sp. OAct 916]
MTTPVFAHGHLRLYLLSLLADQPRHGYELIQSLSERFGGTYSPSAGTIYPRLAKLEDEKLVTKVADGRKSVYQITDAGRAELAARQADLADVEDGMNDSVRRLADGVRAEVKEAMRSLRADLAAAARQAKTDSEKTPDSTTTDEESERSASMAAVREAEHALNEFRQTVHTDFRLKAARGRVSPEAVTDLRKRLEQVREDVLNGLGH